MFIRYFYIFLKVNLIFIVFFVKCVYGCQPYKMDFSGCTNEQLPESVKIYNLGTAYFFGLGQTKIDIVKGCDLFEESAEMGFGLAQFNLGHCYRKGRWKQKNIQKAAYWYKKAVDNDVVSAKASLGALYLYEIADPKKYIEGVQLLQEAKEKGSVNAILVLGAAYSQGLGVEQNYAKALELYEEAAGKGNTDAQALLSHIYAEGLYGLKPNKEKSKYWRYMFPYFEISAKGEVFSVTIEGFIAENYRKGMGLPKSEEKYQYYMELSKKQKTWFPISFNWFLLLFQVFF